MKQKLLLLLSILLMQSMAYAQFGGGTGTESDPYRIYTAQQLNNVRYHLDKYFTLEQDIDLRDFIGTPAQNPIGWIPIGDDYHDFSGNFEGNYFKIKGLYINANNRDVSGLFRGIIGNVQNLFIETLERGIISNQYGGILAGYAFYGVIKNCHVRGKITGNGVVGSLLGYSEREEISLCSAIAIISGEEAGGLIGESNSDNISNCFAQSTVTGITGNSVVGGFIGILNYSTICTCHSVGISLNPTYGAFIGQTTGGNFQHCVYDAEANKGYHCPDSRYDCYNNGYVFPSDGWGMNNRIFMQNWDFDNIWTYESSYYPILQELLQIYYISDQYYNEISYDACGNRIRRSKIINMNSGSINNFKMAMADTTSTSGDTLNKQPYLDKLSGMDIQIYPNPTNGQLKIHINANKDIHSSIIELYDNKGTKILSRSDWKDEIDIDITEKPTGAYIMQIKINGEASKWKIIKQ